MKTQLLASLGLVAAIASFPTSSTADPELACLESAWQDEIDLQLALQDEITGMVIAAEPDLKEIAELFADSAKQNLAMTNALRMWIWETDPARLDTLDAHRAFSWTDDDRATWVAADVHAAAMQANLDNLNAKLAEHPDGNAYFAFLSEEAQQAQMLEITQNFSERMAEANAVVAGCY